MKEKLKIKVKELLESLDFLLLKDKSSTYRSIRRDYSNLLDILEKKENLEVKDFTIIQDCARMFAEVPPGNRDLGLNILIKMSEVYEIIDTLKDENTKWKEN